MNELAIHDIYCSAYLAASGVPIKRVEAVGPGRWTYVIFDNQYHQADDVLDIWRSNEGCVSVSRYVHFLKQFRAYTFTHKHQMNGDKAHGNGATATLG